MRSDGEWMVISCVTRSAPSKTCESIAFNAERRNTSRKGRPLTREGSISNNLPAAGLINRTRPWRSNAITLSKSAARIVSLVVKAIPHIFHGDNAFGFRAQLIAKSRDVLVDRAGVDLK